MTCGNICVGKVLYKNGFSHLFQNEAEKLAKLKFKNMVKSELGVNKEY